MWVMYTHNDMDGIGCGLIGKVLGFDKIHYCSYNPASKYNFVTIINQTMSMYDNVEVVYMTDISLSQDTYDQIKDSLKKARVVVWFDHHETSLALKDVAQETFKVMNLSTEKSATLQLYDAFKDDVDELSKYEYTFRGINAYDTWNFALSPIAKDMQRVYDYMCFQDKTARFIKFTEKVNRFMECLKNEPLYSDSAELYPGWFKSCLRMYELYTKPKIQGAIDNSLTVKGRACLIKTLDEDNIPTFELSWYLTDKLPDVKYAVYHVVKRDNMSYISLRFSSLDPSEDPDIDLSDMAEKYGGGGHVKASAFTMATDQADSVVSQIVDELQEKPVQRKEELSS